MLALTRAREAFAGEIAALFREWTEAVAALLVRAGLPRREARRAAARHVAAIEGALLLARGLGRPTRFRELLEEERAALVDRVRGRPRPRGGGR